MVIQQTIQINYTANVRILADMFNSVYLSSNPRKELELILKMYIAFQFHESTAD